MKQEIKALQDAAAALGLVAKITFTPAGEEMVAAQTNVAAVINETPIVAAPVAPVAPIVETPVVATPVVETPVVPVAPIVETPVVAPVAPAEDILAQGNAIINGVDTFESFSGSIEEPAPTADALAADLGVAPAAPVVEAPVAPIVETPAAANTGFDLSIFG